MLKPEIVLRRSTGVVWLGACPRTGLKACSLLFLNRSRRKEEAICSIGDDEKRRDV